MHGINSRLLLVRWLRNLVTGVLTSIAEEDHWVVLLQLRNHRLAIFSSPWCGRSWCACLEGDMRASMRSRAEVETRRLEHHPLVVAFADSFTLHAISAYRSLFTALDPPPPTCQASGFRPFPG